MSLVTDFTVDPTMSLVTDFTVDPTAVIRLIQGNLIDRYHPEAIIKELIQNGDDASAGTVAIGFAPDGLESARHPLLRGPAVFVWNDARLTESDAQNLRKFGSNAKYGEKTAIGKFGLGLKSVFHLCEAFFFLSSDAELSGFTDARYAGLLNPWCKTSRYPEWNEDPRAELVRLRDRIGPRGPNWFALWLPMRTKAQADGACIHRTVLDLADAEKLLTRESLVSLVPSLPLLKSVRRLEPTGMSDRSYVLTAGERSRFLSWVESPPADTQPQVGSGRIDGPGGTIRYAFAERWVPGLLDLCEDKSWPHAPDDRGEVVPDKAVPHAAVVLGWHDTLGAAGLDVREAVFLPLTAPAIARPQFSLLAHGCFFLDSGRRGVQAGGDEIRERWNRGLRADGVFPCLLPALEQLAELLAADVAEVVTRELQTSDWFRSNRIAICRDGVWLLRWGSGRVEWQFVRGMSGTTQLQVLDIPDPCGDAAVVRRALPALGELGADVAVTLAGRPRLTPTDQTTWPEGLLSTVLGGTDLAKLLADVPARDYLLQFLDDNPPTGRAADVLAERLGRLTPADVRSHEEYVRRVLAKLSGDGLPGALRATAHLPLWSVVPVSGGERRPTAHLSANALRGPYVYRESPSGVAIELTNAIGQLAVYLVRHADADLLRPELKPCDEATAGAALTTYPRPTLAPPAARVGLLRRLIGHAPRAAVRYLLHGDPVVDESEDLFVPDDLSAELRMLADAALSRMAHGSRVLTDRPLTSVLPGEHRAALGVQSLDADGLATLLEEVGPEELAIRFDPAQRDRVLVALHQHRNVVKRLPLHDAADGSGMRSVDDACFWADDHHAFPVPPSMAGLVTLLRPSPAPTARTVQLEAHPHTWSRLAAVDMALGNSPAEHWEIILSAVVDGVRRSQQLPNEVRDRLRPVPFLPRRAGDPVAPEHVLCGPNLEPALRTMRSRLTDPHSVCLADDLREDVRRHEGLPHLMQRCLSGPELVRRLAGVLASQDAFQIGQDTPAEEELDDWEWALEHSEHMPAAALVAALRRDDTVGNQTGVRQAIHSHLLPTLASLPPSAERLMGILRHLRQRHDDHRGRTGPLYRRYLAQFARLDESIFRVELGLVELLNQSGRWCRPDDLCVAEGVDLAHALDEGHREALGERAVRQRPRNVGDQAINDHQLQTRPDAVWIISANVLRDYFAPWVRLDEPTREAVGAFLAVLGDLTQLAEEAGRLLGGRMPREEVWAKARLTNPPPEGHRRPTRSDMMGRQRFLVELTENTGRLSVVSLLGRRMEVPRASALESLLVGYRIHREDILLEGDIRMHWLNLLRVDPAGLSPADRRRLLADTARQIFRQVYGQPAADLGPVLDHLAGDNSADVEQVQAEVLLAAGEYLRRFGVSDAPELREAFERYRRWRERRAAENRIQDQRLDGTPSVDLEREACQHLRDLISGSRESRERLLAGVRAHLADFRYQSGGVLFELFQNADDANAQLGPAGDRPEVAVLAEGRRVVLTHAGRRVNQPVGEHADRHRRDLSNMVFFNHSDKPASGGAVTGRFGLGFKSVYLVCDRPRVVSGRITFEVLGGVYPQPLSAADATRLRAGTAESATVVELDLRDGVDLPEVVGRFQQLAHLLVVFARRVRTVRFWPSDESATWTEAEIVSGEWGRFVRGGLYPVAGGGLRQVVVFRAADDDGRGAGDVLFGFDGGGFVQVPEEVPSVWVTAPTAECHGLGVAVNAPGVQLDMGRELVQWGGDETVGAMGRLGERLGVGLIALFDIMETAPASLPGGTDRVRFWEQFAAVGLGIRTGPQPLIELFWHPERGAVARLYRERAARPTGFDDADGPYRALVRTGDITHALSGVLCDDAPARSEVCAWPEFREVFPPGTLVRHAEGFRGRAVGLADLFIEWLTVYPQVTSEQAQRFGRVVTRANFPRFDGGESTRLRGGLHRALFRASDESWQAPGNLLVPVSHDGVEADEPRRAAFAPPERVLHSDYPADAIEFFLVCRENMRASQDDMTRWALSADTNGRQLAVLRYLHPDGGGALSGPLAQRLRDDRTPIKWFTRLTPELIRDAGLDEAQLYRLLVNLGVIPVPPLTPSGEPILGGGGGTADDDDDGSRPTEQADLWGVPCYAPETALPMIVAWWRQSGAEWLSRYDQAIYPTGRRPDLGTEAAPNQREWLKLFILGTLQTIGRVNPEQNRGFLQQCEQSGWLGRLLNGERGGHDWLDRVNAYVDARANDLPWGHWLQKFIPIATVARHLEDYVTAFRDINGLGGRFAPHRTLVTREGPDYAGTSVSTPPLTPILGIGACFVLRELVRLGVIRRTERDVDPFCYSPVGRVRRLLRELGGPNVEQEANVMDRSQSIHAFLARHISDPTFGGAFDIPLLLLAEDDTLRQQVLRTPITPGDRP